jgi:hypothetical protein
MAMDRDGALAWLGLPANAIPDEIEAEYRRHSQPLKRLLVEAKSLAQREHWRDELKRMILIRDAALGEEQARVRRRTRRAKRVADWWDPDMDVPADIRDRRSAAQFFGKGTPDAIQRIFYQRSRQLKRRVAHAKSDERIGFYQEALRRLNHLLHLALDVELSDSSFDLMAR